MIAALHELIGYLTCRKFLEAGAAGVVTVLFGSLPKNNFAQLTSEINKGIIVSEDEEIHILTRRKVPVTQNFFKYRDQKYLRNTGTRKSCASKKIA